jgi:hypothetical protein
MTKNSNVVFWMELIAGLCLISGGTAEMIADGEFNRAALWQIYGGIMCAMFGVFYRIGDQRAQRLKEWLDEERARKSIYADYVVGYMPVIKQIYKDLGRAISLPLNKKWVGLDREMTSHEQHQDIIWNVLEVFRKNGYLDYDMTYVDEKSESNIMGILLGSIGEHRLEVLTAGSANAKDPVRDIIKDTICRLSDLNRDEDKPTENEA